MSKQIAGFITEFDQYGRFRITFPAVYGENDKYNTEVQLAKYASIHDGWSPVKMKSFLAKPAPKCFAYMNGKQITDFNKLVQHMAIFEVDFLPFTNAEGWWVRIQSIRIL